MITLEHCLHFSLENAFHFRALLAFFCDTCPVVKPFDDNVQSHFAVKNSVTDLKISPPDFFSSNMVESKSNLVFRQSLQRHRAISKFSGIIYEKWFQSH